MIISNSVNFRVHQGHYRYDPALIPIYGFLLEQIDLPRVDFPVHEMLVTEHRREPQTPALLQKLQAALLPCQHAAWLAQRGITDLRGIHAIDYSRLSHDDRLNLHLYPDDSIIQKHGYRLLDGPVFPDWREGELAGVCVRNTTTDQEFAADAKYTFSNYGWYLYGYDDCDPDQDVYLVEGVFDALAVRYFGKQAVAVGSSMPHPFQLACLRYKFPSIKICLDNDLYGHMGAYVAGKLLRAPVYVLPSRYNDLAMLREQDTLLTLQQVGLDELRELLALEAMVYNRKILQGWVPQRPLPYNQT